MLAELFVYLRTSTYTVGFKCSRTKPNHCLPQVRLRDPSTAHPASLGLRVKGLEMTLNPKP